VGAAIGLVRGPSLVLEYANDELLALLPRDGRGMPLVEAYPEPAIADTIAVFEECFRSGEIIPVVRPAGILVACPRRDHRGRVFGVMGYYVSEAELLGVPRPGVRVAPAVSPLEQAGQVQWTPAAGVGTPRWGQPASVVNPQTPEG
jgi:hypothetical protein